MPISNALGIIRNNLGMQFDSEWGRLFLEMGEAGKLDHIAGHSEPGIPCTIARCAARPSSYAAVSTKETALIAALAARKQK